MFDETRATVDEVPESWRLVERSDLPFLYRLATLVDPRWWRFARHGYEPSITLQTIGSIAAGAVVFDEVGSPVAAAVLADAGAAGTGTFEYWSLPEAAAQQRAREVAPELLEAAFAASGVRCLYHERFDNDPMLLGDAEELFDEEVYFPDFALIDGSFEGRSIRVVRFEAFVTWTQGRAGEGVTPT